MSDPRSPDGWLEHLERKDFQVKIRGYRIEVDEIESALLSLDTVKEAFVVAQEDLSDNKLLAAYIVPSGQPLTSGIFLRIDSSSGTKVKSTKR